MKKLYTILLLALVLAAAAVGLISLVDEDATESKTENRRLASKPEFSLSALLDGSYLAELETYYSDTFPGREMLLKANQKLNGFYHFSGGSEENVLVLDYLGGAEQGGQFIHGAAVQTGTADSAIGQLQGLRHRPQAQAAAQGRQGLLPGQQQGFRGAVHRSPSHFCSNSATCWRMAGAWHFPESTMEI